MKLMSKFSRSGVSAESFFSKSINEMEFSEYDVMIVTSSWDERCNALKESSIDNFEFSILILFDDEDDSGLREKHDKEIIEYLSLVSDKRIIITGKSVDLENIWAQILISLISIQDYYKRSIDILCDLSCMPKYYSLTLLSTCFRVGISRDIHFYYNECLYPEKKDEMCNEEICFTGGEWNATVIRYLEGVQNPGEKSCFTLSIGFEGSKMAKVINSFEPDEVNVIIPSPGFSSEYVERVREANADFFNSFGVKKENEIEAHAADPVMVWQELVNRYVKRNNENDYFLCAGTKAHSIGLALASLTLKTPTVIYNLPKEYNSVAVKIKPDCWLYKINNYLIPE